MTIYLTCAIDLAGNIGENVSHSLTVDMTRPGIAAAGPSGTFHVPLSWIELTFTEPIDMALIDLDLIAPSGPVSDPAFEVVQLDDSAYRISFSPQFEDGRFDVTVWTTDLAGNAMTSSATVSFEQALPDLVALFQPLLSVDVLTRESVPLTVSVTNEGVGPSREGGVDRLYFSTDDSIDPDDQLLWQGVNQALQPGESYDRLLTVMIPDVTSDGPYYLLWQADADDAVAESASTNNVSLVQINVTPTSELTLVDFHYDPMDAIVGESIQLHAMVRNGGPVVSPASVVAFYVGDPALADQPVAVAAVPPLRTSGTYVVGDAVWDSDGTVPGNLVIYAVLDPAGNVLEADINDNIRARSIQFGRPDLTTTWLWPDELEAGGDVELVLEINNRGNRTAVDPSFDLGLSWPDGISLTSTDPLPDGPDGWWTWSELQPGATATITLQLSLDHLASGEFTVSGTMSYSDRAAQTYDPLSVELPLVITVDHTPPALLGQISPARAAGNVADFAVEADEPLSATPTVRAHDADNHELPVSFVDEVSGVFHFQVDLTSAVDGAVRVAATAHDQVGNLARVNAALFVDRTAPAFSTSLENSLLALGTTSVDLIASEILSGPPTFHVTDASGQAIAATLPIRSGSGYRVQLSVDENTASGPATFVIDGRDLAGNVGTRFGQFYVDNAAPQFNVSVADLMGVGTFPIVVAAVEIPAELPIVTAISANGTAIELGAPSYDGTSYTYPLHTRPETANGPASVQVSVRDAAGNVGTRSYVTIVDTVKPELDLVVTPDPPLGGSSIQIEITSNESLQGIPAVVASRDGQTPLPLSDATQIGDHYQWTCQADSLSVIMVTATDLAGNIRQLIRTFADVAIARDALTLSAVPGVGNDVTASVTVTNTGLARVENVLVRFYDGPQLPVAQLGAEQSVSLDPGETTTVQVIWPAERQGPKAAIFVAIDPDRTLPETDETNNIALRGPVLISPTLPHRTYLLSDLPSEVWAVPYDSTDLRLLTGEESAVYVGVENEDGDVIVPWQPAAYDPVDSRFEFLFDPATVVSPGNYNLVFQAAGSGFAPAVKRSPIQVIRDFSLEIQTDAIAYERGAPVTISGHASNVDGSPLEDLPISVVVSAQYGVRQFSLVTNSQGGFSWAYQPADLEAGAFSVTASATQGEIKRSSETATFEIRGLYLQAPRATAPMYAGDQRTLTYTIRNVGTQPITGLSVVLEDLGGDGSLNSQLNLSPTAIDLAAGQVTTVEVVLTAGQQLGTRQVAVLVTDEQGSLERATLEVEIRGRTPFIQFDPPQLETVSPVGGTQTREITVRNTGWYDVNDVVLDLSNPTWVSIAGVEPAGGILAGLKGLSDEGFGLFDKYSVLGRVGLDGDVFQIGSELSITAPATGELFLRINEADSGLSDNRGFLPVRVHRQSGERLSEYLLAPDDPWQASGAIVVSGQKLRITADGVWETATGITRDADGNGAIRFSVAWEPNDPALVDGQPKDWTAVLSGTNIGTQEMQFRSWVTAAVESSAAIAITDPIGQPIPGASVTLYSQHPDPETRSFPIYRLNTDVDGLAAFVQLRPDPTDTLFQPTNIRGTLACCPSATASNTSRASRCNPMSSPSNGL